MQAHIPLVVTVLLPSCQDIVYWLVLLLSRDTARKMAALLVISMLILVSSLCAEAANIPLPEGKSVEDIFKSLKSFRSNIKSLISTGITAIKNVKPSEPKKNHHQSLQPPSHQSLQPPSPQHSSPLHVPHHLPLQVLYVTSPPDLGYNSHLYFDTQEPYPQSLPDLSIAAEPVPPSAVVRFPDSESPAGPHSFVDSARLNAGVAVDTSIHVQTIPDHLWREDIDAIQSHCNKESENVKKSK